MRALFKKLEEYLSDEYSPDEVIEQIKNARIKKVTNTKVHIVYDTGVLEVLKLKNNKLVSTDGDEVKFEKW